MSEVIAASKAKCKVCKAPTYTLLLQPAKNGHVIDKLPVEHGNIKIIDPGLVGDKKRPAVGVHVSGGRGRYRSHRCPTS